MFIIQKPLSRRRPSFLPLKPHFMSLLVPPSTSLHRPPLLQRRHGAAPLSRRYGKARKVTAFYGLTSLPYEFDALEPYMSKKTLEIHWGQHHRTYVEKLNKELARDSLLYGRTLEELVKRTYNNGNLYPEFVNAAQLWNHDFFWESMQPGGPKMPQGAVLLQIEKDFGSIEVFKKQFTAAALSLFGSGWVWLALKPEEKKLTVVRTINAVNPLVRNDIPLLALDMWEHAYILDYQLDVRKYVQTFLDHLISWHMVTVRMMQAEAFVNLGEPVIPVVWDEDPVVKKDPVVEK